ncbi:MAG: LysM peptidoglycan-binding domain-containing protein [Clostridia bacterium]|nr:LysM peptidoglycan-binding domain-containing protein [Clostridia bacterium]
MKMGIDISSHNGYIDMAKVKKSNVSFIILRVGYGIENLDEYFFRNYKEVQKYNIPVGVYFYSYATNKVEALKEAQFVMNTIRGLNIEYPVYIDMEDSDGYKNSRRVTYSTCIDICEAFCDFIEKQGYYVGIYANLDWLNNKINNSRLDRFDKWVAQWNDKCDYKKKYGLWQYSSKGKISGINTNVDLNYALKDYMQIIKSANLNQGNKLEKNYIIKKGDTLSEIAQKYNIDWQIIYEQNKEIIGDNPDLIIPGQILTIYKGERE